MIKLAHVKQFLIRAKQIMSTVFYISVSEYCVIEAPPTYKAHINHLSSVINPCDDETMHP